MTQLDHPSPAPTEPPDPPREGRIGLSDLPVIDNFVLLSFAPTVLFLAVNEIFGARPAIGVALASTLALFVAQRRMRPQQGVIFMLAVFGLVLLAGGAVIGLILDSSKAYWAKDPAGDFLVAAFLGISLVMGKPLAGLVIREVFPRIRAQLPIEDRAFVWITLIFLAENLVMGILRIWLLDRSGVTEYWFLSRGIAVPIRIALIWWSIQLIRRSTRERLRDGPDDDPPAPPDSAEVVAHPQL